MCVCVCVCVCARVLFVHSPRIVKIDGTDSRYGELAGEFSVRGYPTLVLVAPVDTVSSAQV